VCSSDLDNNLHSLKNMFVLGMQYTIDSVASGIMRAYVRL